MSNNQESIAEAVEIPPEQDSAQICIAAIERYFDENQLSITSNMPPNVAEDVAKILNTDVGSAHFVINALADNRSTSCEDGEDHWFISEPERIDEQSLYYIAKRAKKEDVVGYYRTLARQRDRAIDPRIIGNMIRNIPPWDFKVVQIPDNNQDRYINVLHRAL